MKAEPEEFPLPKLTRGMRAVILLLLIVGMSIVVTVGPLHDLSVRNLTGLVVVLVFAFIVARVVDAIDRVKAHQRIGRLERTCAKLEQQLARNLRPSEGRGERVLASSVATAPPASSSGHAAPTGESGGK